MSYKLPEETIKKVINNGANEIFQYYKKFNTHYPIIGVSGGLDSSIVLGFAYVARKIASDNNFILNPLALIMPCKSNPKAEDLAMKTIRKFNADYMRIDLSIFFDFMKGSLINEINLTAKRYLVSQGDDYNLSLLEEAKKVAAGNIKARLRMMCGTYHFSKLLNGIVLSTDNLSEWWMGFWTIGGDVGDFGVIQKMLKGLELPSIAKYLGVPQETIDARPDPDLGLGTDDDQLPGTYPVRDEIMIKLIQKGFYPNGEMEQIKSLPDLRGFSKQMVIKVAEQCLKTAYKRKSSTIPGPSRKELGLPEIGEIEF